jgi:DNA-binding response OmpR family regulator
MCPKEIEVQKMKILIVDDDEELARAVSIRLSSAGYECVRASNGEEGYSTRGTSTW